MIPNWQTSPKTCAYATLLSLVLSLLPGWPSIEAQTQDDGDSRGARIDVSSVPSGAEVYVMGTAVGITPLSITERDIYPISYDPKQEHLYGSVQFRKVGCEDFQKRLTRSDVANGLSVQLVCANSDSTPSSSDGESPVRPPRQSSGPDNESSVAEERLRQLRVIEELQDQGFITDQEARSIRQRLLKVP